jgi:hypothetical protein
MLLAPDISIHEAEDGGNGRPFNAVLQFLFQHFFHRSSWYKGAIPDKIKIDKLLTDMDFTGNPCSLLFVLNNAGQVIQNLQESVNVYFYADGFIR